MFSTVSQELAHTRGEEARCDVHDHRDQLRLLGGLGSQSGYIVFTGGNKGGIDKAELAQGQHFDGVAVLLRERGTRSHWRWKRRALRLREGLQCSFALDDKVRHRLITSQALKLA